MAQGLPLICRPKTRFPVRRQDPRRSERTKNSTDIEAVKNGRVEWRFVGVVEGKVEVAQAAGYLSNAPRESKQAPLYE